MCAYKLKYVTFSSAFSSRYAKTRTSNFRKEVQQHTEGTVGSIIWVLLAIYLAFQQCKDFENPLRIDKVIAMSLVYYFLGHSVYCCVHSICVVIVSLLCIIFAILIQLFCLRQLVHFSFSYA